MDQKLFCDRTSRDSENMFWTHLKILRQCNIVAVQDEGANDAIIKKNQKKNLVNRIIG